MAENCHSPRELLGSGSQYFFVLALHSDATHFASRWRTFFSRSSLIAPILPSSNEPSSTANRVRRVIDGGQTPSIRWLRAIFSHSPYVCAIDAQRSKQTP